MSVACAHQQNCLQRPKAKLSPSALFYLATARPLSALAQCTHHQTLCAVCRRLDLKTFQLTHSSKKIEFDNHFDFNQITNNTSKHYLKFALSKLKTFAENTCTLNLDINATAKKKQICKKVRKVVADFCSLTQ